MSNRARRRRRDPEVSSRALIHALMICFLGRALIGPGEARADNDLEITRIVILDFQVVDTEQTLSRHLSSQLALSVRDALPGAEILDQDDIRRLLQLEAERLLLGCEDETQCITEIGGALGARHLATGSVGRLGERYTVELKLFDTGRARTIRHLGERGIESPERLLDVVAILGAHLVDPSQPAEAGFVDIGGNGRVSIDGTLVGDAPLRRQRVASGSRRLVWEDGSRIGVTLSVETYSSQRVDPSMGRALRSGEAPPLARAEAPPPPSTHLPPGPMPPDPGPDSEFPPHVQGDLGPVFARFGLGAAGLDGGGGMAMAYQVGLTLGTRWDVFFFQSVHASDRMTSRQTGFGAGPLLGKSLRVRPSLVLAWGKTDVFGRGATVGIGLDAAFAMNRYLEIGVDLGAGVLPGGGARGYRHSVLYLGIPSATRLPYTRSNFARSGWFWATGSVVTLGILTTLLATAGI